MSCWQCGTVLSTAGGRCPACGAEQPPPTPRQTAGEIHAAVSHAPLAPFDRRPRREEAPPPSSSTLPWVLLVAGLAAIGVGAAVFVPRKSAPAADAPDRARPAPSAAADKQANPDDFGPMNTHAVDPMDMLGKAKTRALAWSKDALLVSMRVRPVVSGRVDVAGGGAIEYWFGKPIGEGFGPGAKVAGKRLHVTVDSGGVHVEETAGTAGRAALEPNCPLDAAAHAAQATKMPAGPLLASYEVNAQAGRPAWQISSEAGDAPSRLVDGQSCAVLVR